MLNRREMDLNEALLARVERVVPDDGDAAEGLVEMTDAEIEVAARRYLAEMAGAPFRVFAYGSLIWKPEFEFVEASQAVIYGWRRSFCITMHSFRATRDQPGLMLALERGESVRGMAFRLPEEAPLAQMKRLLKREGAFQESMPCFRWLPARVAGEIVKVLVFYAMPKGHAWVDDLPVEEKVRRLARAAGRMGSCAAYLRNTVQHLEEKGIHDRYLWDLQRRVAAEIAGMEPLVQQ